MEPGEHKWPAIVRNSYLRLVKCVRHCKACIQQPSTLWENVWVYNRWRPPYVVGPQMVSSIVWGQGRGQWRLRRAAGSKVLGLQGRRFQPPEATIKTLPGQRDGSGSRGLTQIQVPATTHQFMIICNTSHRGPSRAVHTDGRQIHMHIK